MLLSLVPITLSSPRCSYRLYESDTRIQYKDIHKNDLLIHCGISLK